MFSNVRYVRTQPSDVQPDTTIQARHQNKNSETFLLSVFGPSVTIPRTALSLFSISRVVFCAIELIVGGCCFRTFNLTSDKTMGISICDWGHRWHCMYLFMYLSKKCGICKYNGKEGRIKAKGKVNFRTKLVITHSFPTN